MEKMKSIKQEQDAAYERSLEDMHHGDDRQVQKGAQSRSANSATDRFKAAKQARKKTNYLLRLL